MVFFGTVVRPGGKPTPLVPHADGFVLHLSQAALAADAAPAARASLLVHVGGEREPVVLCTLCAGSQDTVPLDQFVSEYVELSVVGGAPVHLTGYYSPEFGADMDDEEGEEGEEEDADYALPGHPLQHLMYGMGGSDSDEDGRASDEDESLDEDESSDEGEDDSDDGGLLRVSHKEPSVTIEDITDQEAAKAAAVAANGTGDKKRKAQQAPEPADAKKQAVGADKQQQQQQQQAKQGGKQQQDKQQQKKGQQQQQQGAQPQQQAKKQQDKQQQDKQQQQQQQQAAKTPDSKAAAAAAASPAAAAPPSSGSKKGAVKRYDNGFEVHHVALGDPYGKLAKGGKTVKVRYVGRLKNGKVFDKTDRKPFSFRLGVGEVVKGWDRGIEGMRVGDKRKLVIPPQMGYGSQKMGPIPPNSWLEFDVELVDVK